MLFGTECLLLLLKGWFGEDKNIEEILAKKGLQVPTITKEHVQEYVPSPVEEEKSC